jgi:hypothetical protein
MKQIKIDEKIAMPDLRVYNKKFPFDNLKVGNSFAVKLQWEQSLMQAMCHHHKRKNTKRFITRKRLEDNKWVRRCWRVS